MPDSISSRLKRSLCFTFRCFSFGRFCLAKPPESLAPCWRTVATVYPLGNCDSLKPETSLSYLTQLETVSHRFSLLSSFFALTDSARTLPEELVNPASGLCFSRNKLRGTKPTSLTRSFPGRPGLSLRFPASFFRPPPAISALSMNCGHHKHFSNSEYLFLSTELFTEIFFCLFSKREIAQQSRCFFSLPKFYSESEIGDFQ